MRVESVTLRNFRCFGDAPVTIGMNADIIGLVGMNGSGKTSVLQAIARIFSPLGAGD